MPDRRAEVKLLDFLDIPGITPGKELTKAQKAVLAQSKKAKCDHPTHALLPCGRTYNPLLIFFLYISAIAFKPKGLLSDSAISNLGALSQAPASKPNAEALSGHIRELEFKLHNLEFRLQYFYNQRSLTLQNLGVAKRQLDSLGPN